jgi:outer membrane protein assembly factor BamB
MVLAQGNLWVAESGQRSLVDLDPKTGAVIRRVNVGRLPVGMTRSLDGIVNALVETDKLVWRQTASGAPAKPITGLEGCPDAIASGDPYLWILTEPDCSSESSRLIRIDPRNGSRASTALLGQSDEALFAGPGRVWIAHAQTPALSLVDANTLSAQTADIADASLRAISGCCGHVYVGGRLLSNAAQGIVSAIDPKTSRELRRQLVDQRVAFMASDDEYVVAVGEKGEIWVFSADSLDLRRTVRLTVGPFEPRSVLIDGDTLYIASQKQESEHDSVFVLEGWRPAAAKPPTPIATPSPLWTTECHYHVVNLSPPEVLWMYKEPDINSAKLLGIPANGAGISAERCVGNWCLVNYSQLQGWVWFGAQNLAATCS